MKITITITDDEGRLLAAANEVPNFEIAEEELGKLERFIANQEKIERQMENESEKERMEEYENDARIEAKGKIKNNEEPEDKEDNEENQKWD